MLTLLLGKIFGNFQDKCERIEPQSMVELGALEGNFK